MSHLRLKQFLPSLLALLILILCSCSDNSTGVTPERCLEESSNLAQITGLVKYADTQKFKVLATNMISKDSLKEINCPYSEATTNAEGEFSLRVNEEDVENLIIMASPKDEPASVYNTLTVFLPEPIHNGNTYQTKPMDYESTAETKVYMHIVQDPNVEDIHKSEIEGFISEISAGKILSTDFNTQDLAKGILKTGAFRNFYLYNKFPAQAEQIKNQLLELLGQEYQTLINKINVASDSIEVQNSYLDYYTSVIEAHYEIGLNQNESAVEIVVAQMVYTDFIRVELGSIAELRTDAHTNKNILSAFAIKNAVENQLDSTSLSIDTKQKILDAGEPFVSQIFETKGDKHSEVREINEQYHDKILLAFTSDLPYEPHARSIEQIDRDLNSEKYGGAAMFFQIDIDGKAPAEQNFKYYQNYRDAVNISVHNELSGKLSQKELDDLAYFMRLINMLPH